MRLRFILYALVLGTIGCDQKFKNELSASVDCLQIEKALNQGIDGTFTNMAVGQYVQMENKYFTFNGPWVKYQDMSDLIVDILPHSAGKELHIVRTTVDYSGQSAGKSESKEVFGLATADYPLCPEAPVSGVSFHNFKVSETKETAPTKECTGTACDIRVNTISFDIADLRNGTDKRYNYLFKVSRDVPYLARFLSQCSTSKQDVNGVDVPVTQCTDVTAYGVQAP